MGLYANPSRLKFQKKKDLGETIIAGFLMGLLMALIGFACLQDERDAQALAQAQSIGKR